MSTMDSQLPANGLGRLSEAATTEITVGAVVFIFLLFIIALFSYLHAKGYWGANPAFSGARRRDSQVFNTADSSADSLRRGLDASAIKALSSFKYKPENFKEGLECSVCLSELYAGDEARLLPLCNHAFHVECIDKWFKSNSTCPLCRCPVLASEPVKDEDHRDANDVSSVVVADEGSSSSGGDFSVVEIPGVEDGLPVSTTAESLDSVEEVRLPAATRLQTLRRFWRGVAGPCGPRMGPGSDDEEGVSSVLKIPTCLLV